GSLLAVRHSHRLAIDVGVSMLTSLPPGPLELSGNLAAFQNLARLRGDDLHAGAFGRLERRLSRHLLRMFHGHVYALHVSLGWCGNGRRKNPYGLDNS